MILSGKDRKVFPLKHLKIRPTMRHHYFMYMDNAVTNQQVFEAIQDILNTRFSGLLTAVKTQDWQFAIVDAKPVDMSAVAQFQAARQVSFMVKVLGNKKVEFPIATMYFGAYLQAAVREELAKKFDANVFDGRTREFLETPPQAVKDFLSFLKHEFSGDKNHLKLIRKHWMETFKALPPHLRGLEGGFSVMA